MRHAKLMTVDQAELSGKSPCPVCLGGTPIEDIGKEINNTTPTETTNNTTSNGATEVWITIEGSKYHSTSSCSEIATSNPGKARLDWAVKNGYKRCTTCDAPALQN